MSTLETPRPAAPPAADDHPRLAEGVELVGEYKDSGFKTPPWIVRRGDGQVIQLPLILYRIAEAADGRRSLAEIAEHVSHAVRRKLDAETVRLLVDEQLRRLGVLAAADGSSPRVEKLDPLLALKFRTAVVPERLTRVLTTLFRPLFATPVVAVVVVALFAVDAWLLGVHGIDPGLRAVIYRPALLLALLGGVVLATAFHEIGHATACRYGGANPGAMGVGIYIVWPAFYTDVTDAYRLGRGGRLRTDLGGIYFNAIFALAATAVYAATRFEALLLLVLVQNFVILQQLLPLVRLDGYYVISDLTGVPDMFARIAPVLKSLVPGRRASKQVSELKPWVRGVVTAYVLFVVPLLAVSIVLMILHAPRAFATAYDSVGVRWHQLTETHGPISGAISGLQLVMLVLPCAGMVLTSGRVGGRVGRSAWRWSAGSTARRGLVVAVAGSGLALAAYTWWPNGDYRPIQPGERGTLAGAMRSIVRIPSGRPSLTAQRAAQLGGAPSELAVLTGQAVRNAAAAGRSSWTADRSRRNGPSDGGGEGGASGTGPGPAPPAGTPSDTGHDSGPTSGATPGTEPDAGETSPAPGSTATPTPDSASPSGGATPAPTPTPTPTAGTATPTPTPTTTTTTTPTATASAATSTPTPTPTTTPTPTP